MKFIYTILLTVGLAASISYPTSAITAKTEYQSLDTISCEVSIDSFDISTELPCKQMYYYIEKYSKEYGIPSGYLYAIAYNESKYQGPLDYTYYPAVKNKSGARGPMQIMPATARLVHNKPINLDRLQSDIEFNIKTSCMCIKRLYEAYNNDFELAFGAYATGKPCRNSDAKRIMKKSYIWIQEK